MSYQWYYEDDTAAVMTGANAALTWGGIITRTDGYEGYNTKFGVTGSVASYHVHFRANTTLAVTVRYFGGGGGEGDNVTKFLTEGGYAPDSRKDLPNLATWCAQNGYPNHASLMNNLAAVIPAGRIKGEIA